MKKLNRSKAYRKFYEGIEKEREFFLRNGMPKEDVEVMLDIIKCQFKSDCVYNQHNVSLYLYTEGMEEDGKSPFLVMGMEKIQVKNKKEEKYVYLNWIDEIKNKCLRNYFDTLSITEKIIFTEIFFNKRTKVDIAENIGLSRQTVSKMYNKILGELKTLTI